MKNIYMLFIVIQISLASFSQDGNVRFQNLGFSIQSLEPKLKDMNESQLALQMFLPTSEEFAPNINVIVQKYQGSIQEYKKLSDDQFSELKVNMIKSEIINEIIYFEYTTDKFGTKEVHVYSKAYIIDDSVYLATGTTTINQ